MTPRLHIVRMSFMLRCFAVMATRRMLTYSRKKNRDEP
jgi:hypothetical protein